VLQGVSFSGRTLLKGVILLISCPSTASSNSGRLHQGCRNSGRRVARTTKFCVLAHDICGSSVQNFVTPGSRIFGKCIYR
jgi:hypothetical protein